MGLYSLSGLTENGGLVDQAGFSGVAGLFTPESSGDPLGIAYYFFDPESLSDGAVTSWNGRVEGSINGDVDFVASQATGADQPVKAGSLVDFADNTDHLDLPSTTQAGWQIVGTSLGTFSYKVDNDAITELNLLGNAATNTAYRQAGDLYGIILLPETATNKDINEARRLLIDRGASEVVSISSLTNVWRDRQDIVEFGFSDTSSVTIFSNAWQGCSSLTSFPLVDTSSGTAFNSAWRGCSSLTSFPLIDTSSGTNFSFGWYQASGLTSFPLLDTSSGTNFNSGWRNCASLTSFPEIDISSGTSFHSTWRGCASLESFPLLDASSGTNFNSAWRDCDSVESFAAGFFDSWNPASISNAVFSNTWDGCDSLTTQSVENILVSIAASGKYATSTGLSGGSALADATIDIDYNAGTGSLTTATTSAITTLKSRGWGININNVLQ